MREPLETPYGKPESECPVDSVSCSPGPPYLGIMTTQTATPAPATAVKPPLRIFLTILHLAGVGILGGAIFSMLGGLLGTGLGLLFAAGIGPLVHRTLPLFDRPRRSTLSTSVEN